MAYTLRKGRVDPMRLSIWRIRALVVATLLFWQCGESATGPEQQTLRERLIGTWHVIVEQDSSEPDEEPDEVGILRFRDDGTMTLSILQGSFYVQVLYARWELEKDSLTLILVRSLDELDSSSSSAMIAFEDEALIIVDPDSDERYTYQSGGIPPEAIPEGNALHGTVTYSDGPYDGIMIGAFKFESEDASLYEHGAAFLLVPGEWEIWGLEDGAWFVGAAVYRESLNEDDDIAVSPDTPAKDAAYDVRAKHLEGNPDATSHLAHSRSCVSSAALHAVRTWIRNTDVPWFAR